MEKTKRRKVIFSIVNFVLMVLVFAGMFAISMSAGFAAIGFSILGAAFGSYSKNKRMQQEFYNKMLDHKEDLLNGKVITVYADEDALSIMISDGEEEKTSQTEKESKNKKQKKAVEK